MNGTQWILFILLVQVIHFLGNLETCTLRRVRKAWEAAIPIYNGIVLMKIINRPKPGGSCCYVHPNYQPAHVSGGLG